MTREEAIKLLKQYQGYEPMFPDGETLKHAFDLTDETVDTLLAALRPVSRERVEMMRATLEPTTLPDGTKTVATKCSECGAHNLITHLFCWRCGSPLTDVAVDILVRRLEEALKDGD